MKQRVNWQEAIQPLIKKYKGKPHPLEFKNTYQLLVMVVLSAQDSDKNINHVAPSFFEAFPTMEALAAANEAALQPYLKKVRNNRQKINWLMETARAVKHDENIPLTMEELVKLKGIGRKSANVIMRGAGVPAEGVIVDLHVVRVAPRLGIAEDTDPKKIEEQIMAVTDKKDWQEIGMAISFLGRETCRPSHPEHHECVMTAVCEYYRSQHKGKKQAPVKVAGKKPTVKKTAAKKITLVKKSVRKKPPAAKIKKPIKKGRTNRPLKKTRS